MLFSATARASDSEALDQLLAVVPDRGEVRSLLGKNFFGQMYERETKRDFWLGSDGKIVVCITIAGVNLEDAAKIRAAFDQKTDTLDKRTVASLVSSVTGLTVQVAN
jgi:hypothetical protein